LHTLSRNDALCCTISPRRVSLIGVRSCCADPVIAEDGFTYDRKSIEQCVFSCLCMRMPSSARLSCWQMFGSLRPACHIHFGSSSRSAVYSTPLSCLKNVVTTLQVALEERQVADD